MLKFDSDSCTCFGSDEYIPDSLQGFRSGSHCFYVLPSKLNSNVSYGDAYVL